MITRRSVVFGSLVVGAVSSPGISKAIGKTTAKAVPPRMVMTWAPPYSIALSRRRLQALYGGVGPRNAITHLGLQFWVPAADGGVARATSAGTISDQTIRRFVNWGHANGIKVLLCVYNADGGHWDWNLAKNAFHTNRAKFINQLIREMQRFKLDGIDVDLEALDDAYPEVHADKPKYVSFIKQLSPRVHALDKVLTLDTFSYTYHGPNQTWWPALFPHVDGITSMGYESLGRDPPPGSAVWQSYAFQKDAARGNVRKLMIGMPSNFSTWLGNSAAVHAGWFLLPEAERVGVSIWDARCVAGAWRAAPVWQKLKQVRED